MNPEIRFRYLKAVYCTGGYFNSAVKKARVHVDAACQCNDTSGCFCCHHHYNETALKLRVVLKTIHAIVSQCMLSLY